MRPHPSERNRSFQHGQLECARLAPLAYNLLLENDMSKVNKALDTAIGALTKIASFDDSGANYRLRNTGSYSLFDEPGAVQKAREALIEIQNQLRRTT